MKNKNSHLGNKYEKLSQDPNNVVNENSIEDASNDKKNFDGSIILVSQDFFCNN